MTFRELLSSVTRREWKFVWLSAAAAVFLLAIPPVVGYVVGWRSGTPWSGVQYLAPGDLAVYLSFIEQSKAGAVLLENKFTTQETVPAFNLLWWAVGRLAAVLSLSAIAAYHVARSLLIPVLAAVAYLCVSYFFCARRERQLAFVLLFFSSGLGAYFAPLFVSSAVGERVHEWPIDLWVSEAHLFASMSYSPHFVASWILLLLAALFLVWSFEGGRWRYAALAGACAFLLFQFHPYHAPTLYALGGVGVLLSLMIDRSAWRRRAGSVAIFVMLSAPAVLYHYVVMNADQMGREIVAASYTPTPSPIHLLIGFGVFVGLAPIGTILLRRKNQLSAKHIFLWLWIGSALAMSYAGFVFERRLVEGLQFPLVVLSVPAIVWLIDWWRRTDSRRTALAIVPILLAAVLFFPSSFAVLTRHVSLYLTNDPPIAFFSSAERQALDWIGQATPADAAFVGYVQSGMQIVGWGNRRTYFGHWVNSGNYMDRRSEVVSFFSELTDSERAEFMRRHELNYVYYGPRERPLGQFEESEYFSLEYSGGDIEIYRLR
ncbi:MAG: DUF6541 family protein [Patescibacteria group bacterium]